MLGFPYMNLAYSTNLDISLFSKNGSCYGLQIMLLEFSHDISHDYSPNLNATTTRVTSELEKKEKWFD